MPAPSSFKKQFSHACHLAEAINTYAVQLQLSQGMHQSGASIATIRLIDKLQGIWQSAATATPELARVYRESIKKPSRGKILNSDRDIDAIDEAQAGHLVGVVLNALFLWEATERAVASNDELKAFAHNLDSRTLAQAAQQKLLHYHCLMTRKPVSHHQAEIHKSIDALLSEQHATEAADEDDFTLADLAEGKLNPLTYDLDVELLDASAWFYEQRVRSNPRYLSLSTGFDTNGYERAGLINELKRFVAATVVGNDPDRFQTLWKATIGSAISGLTWKPPRVFGGAISKAAPSDPLVRRALRVLRMVHELHKVGYQRLRVLPYENGSGTAWRAEITHANNVQDDGFNLIDHDLEEKGIVARYSTSQGNQYFGWEDATTADARELARLFLQRFGHLANLGQGLDWAYAGWLVDVIGWTEQCGDESGLVCLMKPDFNDPENMARWQPPPPIRLDGE